MLETILTNVISSFVVSALVFLYALSGKFRIYLLVFLHYIKFKFMNKKVIFVWNDDEIYYSDNIIASLKSRNKDYHFIALNAPEEILYYPLLTKHIHLINFFVADVTKLSSNNKIREKIQTKILSYVSKGGTFVGSHDILYRRTKNEKFQVAFGCKITKFQTIQEPIIYKVNDFYKEHPILAGLPEQFPLEDHEVCWGEWDDAAHKLLVLETNFNGMSEEIPLLVLKEYENGILIWINSGDKGEEGLCKSIKNPDGKLIHILANIINYVH